MPSKSAQKSASIPLPPSLRARTTESQKHPGAPDKARPRRSTQEVQAEKAAKEKAILDEQKKREDAIADTARIEKELDEQHQQKLRNANHPPPTAQKKVVRPRAAKTASAMQDPEEVPDLSSDSGDEYVAPAPGTEGEDEVDDDEDEVLDMSEEEPMPVVEKTQRKRKGKKPKGTLRSEVKSATEKFTATVPEGIGKRKVVKDSEPHECGRPQKKARKTNTGLHADWLEKSGRNDDDDVEMLEESYPRRRSLSSGSRMSISSASVAPTTPGEDFDGLSGEEAGGISDDAGEVGERLALSGRKVDVKASGSRIRSLAKIVPTISVPTFIEPKTSTQIVSSRARREDIRIVHLPPHLQHKFNTLFTPRLIEAFGYTLPWEQPPDDELIGLWTQVFPEETTLDFSIRSGTIVKKLIEDRLAQWRNKFGSSGLAMIRQIHFPLLPDNSKDARGEWCTWAISRTDCDQPFYYHEYEEKEGKIKSSGIFQLPLIASILGTHLSSISAINPLLRSEKKPIGALVHSIQAAKRAISWWMSGEEIRPSRPYSDYSKANWGDHTETREGRIEQIKTTSNLIRLVSQLKEKQWKKILEAATLASKAKKETIAPAAAATTEPEPEFILVDDDSDLEDED